MNVGRSNQYEYLDGQLRPSQAAWFERIAIENNRAGAEGHPELDIPYGPHPRQTLDLFRTAKVRRGAAAYFHGGYWQSRDKSGFHFVAPPLVADGFDVALVNYPLSPKMGVADLVVAARASIGRLAVLAEGAPVILIGHSAGAQIAVELGMNPPNEAERVAGILAISGVFDLAPLIDTSLNQKLGLDMAAARTASPLHRVIPCAPRAIFAVGGLETPAFHKQTDEMHQAWTIAGNLGSKITVPDADHFSILDQLVRGDGVLRAALGHFI
ncbi:MAG TPA: alpha/beta hydrolase [Sphingomonas sp.]|jgi:arylformamidase|nr:alpha/beta hydrolase [Sphingomonas sp.]